MGLKPRRALQRSDGKTVDGYIGALGDWRADVVAAVRSIVREAVPNVTESIKWGQPVYESNGPFCYVQAYANQVNFGFWRGAELSDPDGLLTGDGAKMRHIKLLGTDDVNASAFAALIREALELNRTRGNPTR